jgi:ABC-type polysaccharide/polyol phosphate export permease
LWRFREMLYQLTLRDVRIRYKQAVLGFGWALFMPLMVVLAGCLVRFIMVRGPSGGSAAAAPNFLATLAALSVKAMGWSFFVGAIGAATGSLTANIHLVTKVYFPRAVLPLAVTLAHGFDLLIGIGVLIMVLPFLAVGLSTGLLWVPLLATLLFLFTVAASLFLSCANLFYRDVKYIVQILLMFGIFFTPVFFEPAMLGARLARMAMWNPLAPILEGLRLAVVDGHNLLVSPSGVPIWSPSYLAYSAVFTVVALAASATLFHRAEFRFAEVV